MSGFFESRGTAVYNGLSQTIGGMGTYFHETVGWKEQTEKAVGIIGGFRDSAKALLGGIFGKGKGLLRPDDSDSYINPFKKESFTNPFKYLRRAMACILETGATIAEKTVGLAGAQHGSFTYNTISGLGKTLGFIIGDFSHYMRNGQGSLQTAVASG